MSGPKGAAYEIERRRRREELERRRREARERRERRMALEARAGELSAQVDDVDRRWGETSGEHAGVFPEWSDGSMLRHQIEAAVSGRMDNDAFEAMLDGIAGNVGKARRDYAQQRVLLTMHTSLATASRVAASIEAERAREAEQREERALRRHAEQVAQSLKTLATHVSMEDRAMIERRAEEAVAATRGRRNALLVQLRLEIQRVNSAAEARQRVARQVEQWREDLYGLEGSDVEALDRMLRQVADGEASLPPDAEQRVKRVVARAMQSWERDYALGVVAEELENLGYVVEEGFDTASAEAPEMLLRKPDMEDGYHVSLRADADTAVLHARVVREADETDAPRSADQGRIDQAAESAWCGDFATALAAARDKGMHSRLVSRKRPGEVPVGTIAPLAGQSKPRRRRRRRRMGEPMSRSAH